MNLIPIRQEADPMSKALPAASVITADFVAHTRTYEADFALDSYLLRLQYEGQCTAVVGGIGRLFEPGHLLLLPPGSRYRLQIAGTKDKTKPISDFYLYGSGEWMDEWWSKRPREPLVKIPMDQSLLQTWKQINLEKRRRTEDARILDYLLRVLCLIIDRSLSESPGGIASKGSSYLVARMKDYVEEHATDNFTLQDVADHVGLSVSRTVSLFKAAYGKTVMQHAMEVRLSVALDRMQYSKMSLEQVAETCGFGTYSYFFRCFKSRYGLSPGDYRERHIEK